MDACHGPKPVSKYGETECAYCLEDIDSKPTISLPCKHRYHGDCIVKWINIHHNCPTCRVSVSFFQEKNITNIIQPPRLQQTIACIFKCIFCFSCSLEHETMSRNVAQ